MTSVGVKDIVQCLGNWLSLPNKKRYSMDRACDRYYDRCCDRLGGQLQKHLHWGKGHCTVCRKLVVSA